MRQSYARSLGERRAGSSVSRMLPHQARAPGRKRMKPDCLLALRAFDGCLGCPAGRLAASLRLVTSPVFGKVMLAAAMHRT